jgi:hypothetical protein
MYFAIIALDKPGGAAIRAETRERHRAYLRAPNRHGVTVRLGGPTLAGDGAMNGTLLVIEADDGASVDAFLKEDPYMLAGLFSGVEIRPWQWSLGNPDR